MTTNFRKKKVRGKGRKPRNPSRRTCKRLMEVSSSWFGMRDGKKKRQAHFFFNIIGARAYVVSKGKYDNRL
jgi:hypothetical protein